MAIMAVLVLWLARNGQTAGGQDTARPSKPLISRGYTDAPTGTVMIGGDPGGGGVVLEMRVSDGQKVKRDEIIAVLSNFPRAQSEVRSAEAQLEKLKLQRVDMVSGFRVTELSLQQINVQSTIATNKVKALEVARSDHTPARKEIELGTLQVRLEKAEAILHVMQKRLESDLAGLDALIALDVASLDIARASVAQALVRSPIDGVVVDIRARQGESVNPVGIAKVVDLHQLRVFTDVDVLHLGRVVLAGAVEVKFRGDSTAYRGRITRMSPATKLKQRNQLDEANSTDDRVVQVEIELDDPASMPQVVGREARVTFL